MVGDNGGWDVELSFLARLSAYIAILGTVMIIVFLVLKLLGSCDEENHETVASIPNETAPLSPQKSLGLPYGTQEEDPESAGPPGSSSDEPFDGKICVICYDMPRNSFFIPCGHCATCQDCANRIVVENRICPICRSVIHKARKLIIP